MKVWIIFWLLPLLSLSQKTEAKDPTNLFQVSSGFYNTSSSSSDSGQVSGKAKLAKGLPSAFNVTKPMKIGVIMEPPFVMEGYRTGRFRGILIDVLKEAGIALRRKNTVVMATYGMEMQPGEYSGVFGELARGTLDLAVGPFIIHANRSKAMTFTQPLMSSGFNILWRPPKHAWRPPRPDNPFVLFKPFSGGLWFLMTLAVLPVSGLFLLIRRFNPYEAASLSTPTPEEKFVTHFLWTLGSLFWQNGKLHYNSVSGRLLSQVWFLFALLSVGAYLAALMVVVMEENSRFEQPALPFETLDEMVKQSKVKVVGVRGSSTYQYFSQLDHGRNRIYRYWKGNEDTLVVNSTETALKMMNEGRGEYAILMDEAAAHYYASLEPCNKIVLGDDILGFDKNFAFVCPRGSPVCEDLNHVILHMQETGQIEGLEAKWLHGGCHNTKVISYKGRSFVESLDRQRGERIQIGTGYLSIERFSVAFTLLAVGLTVAGLLLGAEIGYFKFRVKPRLTTDGNQRRFDQTRMIYSNDGSLASNCLE